MSKRFILFFNGQILSQVADMVNRLVILWFVYSLTGSVVDTSFVGVMQTSPALLTFFIGRFIDKYNKKYVLLILELLRLLLTLALSILYYINHLNLHILYILTFLLFTVSTFWIPTIVAVVPNFVHKDSITKATLFIQSTIYIGMVLGPFIAGLLISKLNISNILFINSMMFFISFLTILCLTCKKHIKTQLNSLLEDIKIGFLFLSNNKNVLFSFIILLIDNLFFSSLPLMFSSLTDNAVNMNMMMFYVGIGSIIAVITCNMLRNSIDESKLLLLILLIGGGAFISIDTISMKIFLMVICIILGFCNIIIILIYILSIQSSADDQIKGRIYSMLFSVNQIFIPLSYLLTGYLIKIVGIMDIFIIYGVSLILLSFVIFIFGYKKCAYSVN